MAGPLVVGHRGASALFPENTMLAFRRAIDVGADGLEFDVRLSADGTPFVLHDETLDRTTNASGHLGSWTTDALREVDAGSGERIPAVRDVLEAFPTIPLIIELKELGASEPLLRLIEAMEAGDRVVIASFDSRALSTFRKAGISTAATRRETALSWVGSRVGASIVRHAIAAFSVPEWSGRIHVVDQRFVAAARRSGRPVHVWTVNDPDAARQLWSIGVNAVITDVPERLSAVRLSHRIGVPE